MGLVIAGDCRFGRASVDCELSFIAFQQRAARGSNPLTTTMDCENKKQSSPLKKLIVDFLITVMALFVAELLWSLWKG
jgi:hypothetical protein